jgi:hypothetical protein
MFMSITVHDKVSETDKDRLVMALGKHQDELS